MKTIRECMTTNIAYCTPVDNVYEAALKMKQEDVGIIPIVQNDQLIGIVTDRDLVVRGIADKNPGSNRLTEVMTTDIISIGPDETVEKAAQMMAEHQIRRLPVVENGKLIGMVSLGDLAIENYADEQAGIALSEISEDHGNHGHHTGNFR